MAAIDDLKRQLRDHEAANTAASAEATATILVELGVQSVLEAAEMVARLDAVEAEEVNTSRHGLIGPPRGPDGQRAEGDASG